MKNLLRFLIKYHTTILFLFLESVALVLVGTHSSFHKAKLYNLKHIFVSNIADFYKERTRYRNLDDENRRLVLENAALYNSLPSSFITIDSAEKDTNNLRKYLYIPARVINSSVNKQYNFLTIDKGRAHGIEADMAVICDQGIVGAVKSVSNHFATVVSVLNREFHPNARIKSSGFKGYIEWPGKNYREVLLNDIQAHAVLHIGDTIVSSGDYKTIFPEDILIGKIKDFKLDQGVNYQVLVELSTDYRQLRNVMVVKNLLKDEQRYLEDSLRND